MATRIPKAKLTNDPIPPVNRSGDPDYRQAGVSSSGAPFFVKTQAAINNAPKLNKDGTPVEEGG